jgi:predicted double-glycine peptidase
MLVAAGIASWHLAAFPAQASDAASDKAPDRPPVRSILEMREANVVIQKFDLSCGAAALATILQYQFDDPVTERDVTGGLIRRKEYIEHPELVRIRQGFSLLDMKRYVDSRGYRGEGFGQLDIPSLISMAPIIVAVNPIGYNHFVVFRGMLGDKVLLADPAFGNRVMELDKFMRAWIQFPRFGRVGFIVTIAGMQFPPGALAIRPEEFATPSGMAVRETLFHH